MSTPSMIFRSLTIGGNGASAIATVSGGVVRQIIPLTNGSNYFSPPAITLVGNGTGATAQANIIQGQVGTINVTNGGSGYTYPPTVNIISSSGDWNFGQGLSSYFTGNAAIAANIKTALNTFLGDAFWQANFGVDWINLLGNKNTEQSIISQTRAIIANCYGVVQINSINYNLDSLRRQLTLSYTISTIYSSNVTSSSTVSY